MARRSSRYSSRRSSSYSGYRSSYGSEAARRHIQEAEDFSREIGGSDEDVKTYFFALPDRELSEILSEYGRQYGSEAEEYARETFQAWKTRRRRMSGLVAKRLFSLLPRRMPLGLKFELAGNIWRHFGPSSRHAFVVGAETPVELIAETVARTLNDTVSSYNIPSNVAARFDWLADGDVKVKEQLLNHFRQQEKMLAVEKVRSEIPVLQSQVKNHSRFTGSVRSILTVHKHEVAIRVRDGDLASIEVDHEPVRSVAHNSGGEGLLQYWWVAAAALVAFWLFAG